MYNPSKHHRRSIRLKGYDYSSTGHYFITICTQNRNHLFGRIVKNQMQLNHAGQMVNKILLETGNQHPNIKLDEHIIMPNHFHGIITIVPPSTAATYSISSLNPITNDNNGDSGRVLGDIPAMIQSFKRNTTIKYIEMVKSGDVPPFQKRIWQRNYWEHIIRNKNEYNRISQYIKNNPQKWANDKLNGGIGNTVMGSSSHP